MQRVRHSVLSALVVVVAVTGAQLSALAAQKRKERPLPVSFTRVWKYESAELSGQQVAADASVVALPLSDGRLVALSPQDGSLLWSTELGGQICAPPVLTSNAVLVATSREGVELGGVLRALDRSTGLALWTREMPKPVASNLVLYEGTVYFGSADASVYAIREDGGSALWAYPTRGSVRGQIALVGHDLLVGSDDGALYALDRTQGIERWRFQTRGPVTGRVVVTARRTYITSGDGNAYALDSVTHKLIWKSRTGAAIEAGPVLVDDDRLVVVSYDNFVYLLDARTGDRRWKRRMDGRLVSAPVDEGNGRLLVTPLRDELLSVLAVDTGDKVAAFPLDQGDETVGSPTLSSPLLFIPTTTGLVAAREVSPSQQASAEPLRGDVSPRNPR